MNFSVQFYWPRTSDVTLEGLFSSEEFGASESMDNEAAEEQCTPQVNPEEVVKHLKLIIELLQEIQVIFYLSYPDRST